MDDKLKEIAKMCKCGVFVSINEHRDYYLSVKENMSQLKDEVDPDVLAKMIELDTAIQVQAYNKTPIGSYVVWHYDLDIALDKMLRTIQPVNK
jgi:hypothetical protein